MNPENENPQPRPCVLQVVLKASAFIQTMTQEEFALLDGLLRHHYAVPQARGTRARSMIDAAMLPEPKILAVTSFVTRHTFPERRGRIRTTDFMQRFAAWERDTGASQCVTAREMQAILTRAGYTKIKSNGQQVYSGLSWHETTFDEDKKREIQ